MKGHLWYFRGNLANRVRVHPVSPGILYEDEEFTVSCQLLKHRIPAHGYRIAEKDRPGRFDVDENPDNRDTDKEVGKLIDALIMEHRFAKNYLFSTMVPPTLTGLCISVML